MVNVMIISTVEHPDHSFTCIMFKLSRIHLQILIRKLPNTFVFILEE